MHHKIPGPIETITLEEPPYYGERVHPGIINFLYGNNGAGKTTIARAIRENAGISWLSGHLPEDYSVLVYDREFVTMNFQDYSRLKGLFTIGEANVSVQSRLDEVRGRIAQINDALTQNMMKQKDHEAVKAAALSSLQDSCWDMTRQIRSRYPQTQAGCKRDKVKVASRIMNTADAGEQDLESLDQLYRTAFDKNARQYDLFQYPGSFSRLKTASRGFELLAKPITNSGGTPFADFLKRLGAMSWVTEGHEKYHSDAGNRCPYCQQTLPRNFEQQLSSCYDEQYRQDLAALRQYREAYDKDMHEFTAGLRANLKDPYPQLGLQEFTDKVRLLENAIEHNLQIIDDKIRNPSSIAELESIKQLLADIRGLIDDFNRRISLNNAVAGSLSDRKRECTGRVWQHMAFLMQRHLQAYRKGLAAIEERDRLLQQEASSLKEQLSCLMKEQRQLEASGISTRPAVDRINRILSDAGFHGFRMEEHPDISNACRLVRSDGQIAVDLSDGERYFIAFLYFYHLVTGAGQARADALSEGDRAFDADPQPDMRNKIVVIDDPVSCMDSSSMSIIGALVRDLTERCNGTARTQAERSGNDIQLSQIFILTHDMRFHQEITRHQEQNFAGVSFYLIQKTDNKSTVHPCVRGKADDPASEENYNPVRNSYEALWDEYRELDKAGPVLTVARRILNCYFQQLCGYDMSDLRKRILIDGRNHFISVREDGSEDSSQLAIASAMLPYASSSAFDFQTEPAFVAQYETAESYKLVLRLIFNEMGQLRHYNMMMGNDSVP